MDTRRDFIKKASLLAGGAGLMGALPASVQRALAIDPPPGSTWLDAEHIVILMQENRSFDHCFGTLQGVRGFNDPRAIRLPDNNPVWLQRNAAGETYAPFRLNIKDTKATWVGSLPHSWTNQVDARNGGKHDKWLDVKRSGDKQYADMPLTMGYYNREDISFYYALADAFTVCDQNFCSSLTGTTPNRLYLWTGTIRPEPNADSHAKVRNEDVDYEVEAQWATFPERLEDNGISWKIYQNELSLDLGFEGEQDPWLANFTDNPIEWFTQYQVRFSAAYRRYLPKKIATLNTGIQATEEKLKSMPSTDPEYASLSKALEEKKATLQTTLKEQQKYTAENYAKLSAREKNLHEKAFCTNSADPFYHELSSLSYRDGDTDRELQIPKGDVLHQFREDVKAGKLPAVSWLVAPENFSDHPGAPWYGAWYLSETIDILTQNPEVWKKTIFILCYDENDGLFDHVPPFVPPHPHKADSGLTSKGIDNAVEYVMLEQDLKHKPPAEARESPIGLGYRVPLVIASPWSRGGCVNSQVFDHSSVLQFLEKFVNNKFGKSIKETNISAWRRTVCGDLSSVFKPYHEEKIKTPEFLSKDLFIESIHKAKFAKDPYGFKQLSSEEIAQMSRNPYSSALMPRQEKGTRSSCALPYELYVDGDFQADRKAFVMQFKAGNEIFGRQSAGSPFIVFAWSNGQTAIRNYAVAAGDKLEDTWLFNAFSQEMYTLQVHGPNGFFREFKGGITDPALRIACGYQRDEKNKMKLTGRIELKIENTDRSQSYTVEIRDNAYKTGQQTRLLGPAGSAKARATLIIDSAQHHGWYDFSLQVKGNASFEKRYAGRVETGKESITDPVMGGMVV